MQVLCPKCGFSQPKDQYCAKCGVDMDLYKPTPIPTWKKILQNPLLHLLWIFFLAFTSIQFIQKNRRDELKQRIAYLKNGPVVIEKRMNNGETREVQLTSSEQNEQALAGEGTTTLTTLAGKNIGTATSAAAGKNENIEKEWRVRARYLEIDQSTINIWNEEMHHHGQYRQFDNVTLGVLPQYKNRLQDKGIKELQSFDKKISLNSSTEWFAGTHHSNESENESGLLASVVIHEVKDSGLRGDFEVLRTLHLGKEPNKTTDRVSFGSPFDMNTNSAYVLIGLLPRGFAEELDEDLNPDAFLSIFKSRRFLNRQAEFTLLIDFDMNNVSTPNTQERP